MSRRSSIRYAAANPQAGVTLVEIMVAMAIGIILLLGLGTLFSNSTRAFKSSDEFARMQENGAFALNSIGNDLQLAGFYGWIDSSDVQIPPSIATAIAFTDDCAPGGAPAGNVWVTHVAQPLFGFSGLTSAAAVATLPCIKAGNFIASAADRPSFVLVTRGATGAPVPIASLDNATLYVQSAPGGGILFRGDQYAGLPASEKRVVSGGGPAPIYPYQAKAYYLRPCSRPTGTGGTVCLAADDGGQPIPTLVRQELAGTTMREVAVAEGIEAARIIYGVDGDADGAPDQFIEAPTAAQFAQVVSVRLSLLVRSPRPTNGYSDDSRDYDLDGDGTAELNCTDDGFPCNYHRHVFTQSFQVRNVAQRLALPPP